MALSDLDNDTKHPAVSAIAELLVQIVKTVTVTIPARSDSNAKWTDPYAGVEK